jgi:ribosomal-protein-alanine N-acetyltransferase
MELFPIDIDESRNNSFRHIPECVDILNVYPMYYSLIGYSPPWVGYFAMREGQTVGAGGFKGRPRDNKVEIAYSIFKAFEGKGYGTELCRKLVLLARDTDPGVRVTARTLMEENASVKLLKRNGFVFRGVVNDEDDGDVWEWEYLDY